MLYEIKNRWNGSLIYSLDCESMAQCLRKAIDSGINLQSANLQSANLQYANLQYANLQYASLQDANLRSANLQSASLQDANLQSAKNTDKAIGLEQTIICAEGDIIGYKKASMGEIVKILIPIDAKRSNATTRKCRAEYAKVLSISNGKNTAKSKYDSNFIYKVGEIVRPTQPWDTDRWNECSTGIHFFLTEQEAKDY